MEHQPKLTSRLAIFRVWTSYDLDSAVAHLQLEISPYPVGDIIHAVFVGTFATLHRNLAILDDVQP